MLSSPGQDEIVRGALVVVQKIVFNRFCTVPQAQDEILVPIVSVILHYMPEDGPISDMYHRLRNVFRITNTQSHSAAEENDFHMALSKSRSVIKRSRRRVLPAKFHLGSGGIVRRGVARPAGWEVERRRRIQSQKLWGLAASVHTLQPRPLGQVHCATC